MSFPRKTLDGSRGLLVIMSSILVLFPMGKLKDTRKDLFLLISSLVLLPRYTLDAGQTSFSWLPSLSSFILTVHTKYQQRRNFPGNFYSDVTPRPHSRWQKQRALLGNLHSMFYSRCTFASSREYIFLMTFTKVLFLICSLVAVEKCFSSWLDFGC